MRTRSHRSQVSRPAAWRKPLLGAVLVAGLAGCVASEQSIEVYDQQQRANLALEAVIEAAQRKNPGQVDALEQSAVALRVACAALQDAEYSSYDAPVDLSVKIAAYGNLDTCAAKAREIEDLLWRIDPFTAGHYLEHPMVSVAESDPKARIDLYRKPEFGYR